MPLFEAITEKHFQRWMGGYARHLVKRLRRRAQRSAAESAHAGAVTGPRHVLFAFCDHYEPLWNKVDERVGSERVARWANDYPKLAERYHDADGRPPQHTFFFPGEEYRAPFFDLLENLVVGGFGEVELHLHHDASTETSLRADIESYLRIYSERGHLSRDPEGRPRYAFIHGNWALANGRPDGRYCGVDAEVPLLFDTGCYADFTFPSMPDITQPNIVNQIYWPTGDLKKKRCYEQGSAAAVGHSYDDRLLMIQGPLGWTRRAGRLAMRLEYGAITAKDPATRSRVRSWASQDIVVDGRSEWNFIKVYTHGAPEKEAHSLLGAGGHALHQALCDELNDGVRYKLHYVTAREMYNIAMAAMAGKSGDPNDYRDFALPPPPIVARRAITS